MQAAHVQYYCPYHYIMELLPGCRKTVNTFANTSILDAHTFNIIFNPTDIDNIIKRVPPAIYSYADIMISSIGKAR